MQSENKDTSIIFSRKLSNFSCMPIPIFSSLPNAYPLEPPSDNSRYLIKKNLKKLIELVILHKEFRANIVEHMCTYSARFTSFVVYSLTKLPQVLTFVIIYCRSAMMLLCSNTVSRQN